jgi:hypothetical protein
MFLDDTCARNAQDIANLFGEYFQSVYVRDDSQENFIVDDGVEDSFREGNCEAGCFFFGHAKGP